MTRFDRNPGQPTPDFELSRDLLKTIHHELADLARRIGQPTPYNGLFPVSQDDRQPIAYVIPVDGRVAKDLFHTADEQLVPLEDSCVTYTEPHLIDPADEVPNGVVHENVSVVLHWQLADSNIGLTEYYWFSNDDDVISADFNPEYHEIGGQRISMNNRRPGRGLSNEEAFATVEDAHALERPLTIDDTEQLHLLIEALKGMTESPLE